MSSAKILIVDDELIMRESLAGWLQRDGHTIQTAPSGEEALEKLKETHFDIMLVDIKMEGISGLEVLQQVKESDPDVAVVMITAYGSIPTAIEAMKNGAYDYMLKPFDPNELGVLIEKIIRYQEQEREMLFLILRGLVSNHHFNSSARRFDIGSHSPSREPSFVLRVQSLTCWRSILTSSIVSLNISFRLPAVSIKSKSISWFFLFAARRRLKISSSI